MWSVSELKSMLVRKRESSSVVVDNVCGSIGDSLKEAIKNWCGMGPAPSVTHTFDNTHFMCAAERRLRDMGFHVVRTNVHRCTLEVSVKEV